MNDSGRTRLWGFYLASLLPLLSFLGLALPKDSPFGWIREGTRILCFPVWKTADGVAAVLGLKGDQGMVLILPFLAVQLLYLVALGFCLGSLLAWVVNKRR
jgi:hypothetical protein